MAASVLFACGINDQTLPSYVHISEESNVDGSFLISSILGQRMHISNAGTLLVCLQHNYQHYQNAGMRLGYNANIFQGKTLNVIDPLTELADDGAASRWLADERQVTSLLLSTIREQLATNFKCRSSTVVLIDNLSILLNLGATQEELVQLCHELAKLPAEHDKLTVVTKMNNCDIYAPTDGNVAKLGEIRIRVVQLRSGIFREVDGKLRIAREAAGGDMSLSQTKEILYKVNDRNIKIYNPGEIGVKI